MYSSISPARFILGGLIVALPLGLMPEEWRGRYVLLVLVMYIVFNANGLQRFSGFIRRELGG